MAEQRQQVMLGDVKRATEYPVNERTFLAWMRTSVTVVSLGFVVAKFSLRCASWRRSLPRRCRIPKWGASMPIGVTMMTLGGVLAVFTATTQPARADGATIALQGNARGAPACVSCHGAQGEGMPANGFPRLAGLNAGYLQTQLDAFANGQRVNAMMTPIAQTLGADERALLASYYGRMRNPVGAAKSVAEADSPGARLALKGRWSQGLPACVQCHGATGAGVGNVFPALAGQSALYIENQLRGWQQGARGPGPLSLMKVVASKLSATDIQSVAAYFSARPASDPAPGRKP